MRKCAGPAHFNPSYLPDLALAGNLGVQVGIYIYIHHIIHYILHGPNMQAEKIQACKRKIMYTLDFGNVLSLEGEPTQPKHHKH